MTADGVIADKLRWFLRDNAERIEANRLFRERYYPKHPVRVTLMLYGKKDRYLRRQLKRFLGDHRRWSIEGQIALERGGF